MSIMPTVRTLAVLLTLASCGRESAVEPAEATASGSVVAPSGPHELRVCATASLRRPFETIAERYQREHAGAVVKLHFDGGAQLLEALNGGERCDVIALGDNSVMARVVSAGHTAVGSPAELARSRVAIVVAKDNPKQVEGLADLGRADLRIALGARSSSIGRHARWVLSRLPLTPKPALEATTADDVLAAVRDGRADAGIVYATSFAGAGDAVQKIEVPEAQNTPVLYSISSAREPTEPRGAEAFRALALGSQGQEILLEAGFLPIGAKPH